MLVELPIYRCIGRACYTLMTRGVRRRAGQRHKRRPARARDASLLAYARGAAKQNRLDSRHLTEIETELSREGMARSRNSAIIDRHYPDASRLKNKKASDGAPLVARSYAHPLFWAGFIYTGL